MKRAFTLLELIIVIAILLILAGILFPVFFRSGHSVSRSGACRSNLRQLGLGCMQYVQDYNSAFPPARVGTTSGWTEAVFPYVKSWQTYQCPAVPNHATPSTDYFFNSRLGRGFMPHVKNLDRTILIGEGDDDMPVWANLNALPVAWISDQTSPSWRHMEKASYLFADGHVKLIEPKQVSTHTPATSQVTFAIK